MAPWVKHLKHRANQYLITVRLCFAPTFTMGQSKDTEQLAQFAPRHVANLFTLVAKPLLKEYDVALKG
jgi:hypothetical protein